MIVASSARERGWCSSPPWFRAAEARLVGRDVHYDATRAGQNDAFEQGASHRLFGGDASAIHAEAAAEPIIAIPCSAITVRTSWKSTLIKPAR